jgi:hypothetical protein
MVKKNGLIIENKTAIKMLPIFYQAQLQKYLSQSQLITLKLLVWLLQSLSTSKNRKIGSNTSSTHSTE